MDSLRTGREFLFTKGRKGYRCRLMTIGELDTAREMIEHSPRAGLKYVRSLYGRRLPQQIVAAIMAKSQELPDDGKNAKMTAATAAKEAKNTPDVYNAQRIMKFYGMKPSDVNDMVLFDFVLMGMAFPTLQHEEVAMNSLATHSMIEMPVETSGKKVKEDVVKEMSPGQRKLADAFVSGTMH